MHRRCRAPTAGWLERMDSGVLGGLSVVMAACVEDVLWGDGRCICSYDTALKDSSIEHEDLI